MGEGAKHLWFVFLNLIVIPNSCIICMCTVDIYRNDTSANKRAVNGGESISKIFSFNQRITSVK